MENVCKYGAIALIVIPILLMIVVVIFSAVLVLATIPKRNRDQLKTIVSDRIYSQKEFSQN